MSLTSLEQRRAMIMANIIDSGSITAEIVRKDVA
jgi:hypothetical protein